MTRRAEELREAMCEKHDALCEEYNNTEDPAILEQICVLEIALFDEPLMPVTEVSEFDNA